MNVLTGVVLDTAMSYARRANDQWMVSCICDAFHLSLDDCSHYITREDFRASAETGQMKTYFDIIDVNPNEAMSIYNLIDMDGNGVLDAGELVSALLRLQGFAKAMDVALILAVVRQIQDAVDEVQLTLANMPASTRMYNVEADYILPL